MKQLAGSENGNDFPFLPYGILPQNKLSSPSVSLSIQPWWGTNSSSFVSFLVPLPMDVKTWPHM